MAEQQAIIIGAGPAGLTAAYELLQRTTYRPIVLEASDHIGGLSRTVNYKGNRIDIGGHRFFSKSDRVMQWWMERLPVEALNGRHDGITYHQQTRTLDVDDTGITPEGTDDVMLVRERTSRIYFLRKFFAYPISLSAKTLINLGPIRTVKIGLSYLRSTFFPIREEKSLEDFLINRFGRELYGTFFKSYTEKVWGVPCHEISAEWGAQRIKGLSITKAILHAAKAAVPKKRDLAQKDVETSLIEQFLYPKFGPGQMWETVAEQVKAGGGEVHMRHVVTGIEREGDRIARVHAKNLATGEALTIDADLVFSTMPIKDLVNGMGESVPEEVRRVAKGLVYRDFMTVGLLARRLQVRPEGATNGELIPDNWIYIQEHDVKLGRLQVFNNWSPYMVKDPSTVWLGLEYFCDEGDELWSMEDEAFAAFAAEELASIGIVAASDVIDHVVIRMPKTYPAYFGAYDEFDVIRDYLDPIENLFLVGRNGMHKYNNQDHSMLTAMTAVDNIAAGRIDKSNIWDVNTEMEYHEEK